MTEVSDSSEPRRAAPPLSDYLELLAGVGQDFAASLDVSRTLQRALARIANHLHAEAASLFLLERDDEQLTCKACEGPVDIKGLCIPAGQGIIGRAVNDNACQIVRDVRLDPDFASTVDNDTGFTTRSILCAPMSVKDRCVGAIELINKTSGDGLFSEQDRHVLQSMASSAALAIINARLTEQLIEQETLRRELELAAEIQRSLLPAPGDASFPVCGVNLPARSVSGDFYDIFPLADGRIGFNVGDVSGKGINAALLMAKTSSLYRCLGKEIDHPGELLRRVNAELCDTGTRGMFVTLVGGVYDPLRDSVRIANAGHEPPLLCLPDGTYRAYPAQAPPLGIALDLVGEDGYPVIEIGLEGGCLAVFTDGITEWKDRRGAMLGSAGLKRLLLELAPLLPAQRLIALLERLHCGDAPLHDDMTMLLVQRASSLPRIGDDPHAGQCETPNAATLRMRDIASLRVPAAARWLKLVRALLSHVTLANGCSSRCSHDVVLAVDEACQNVIRHAYGHEACGDIQIDARCNGAVLELDISDFAPQVDPAAIGPRDLDDLRPGGLGTHFISECVDHAEFVPTESGLGNRLWLSKTIF